MIQPVFFSAYSNSLLLNCFISEIQKGIHPYIHLNLKSDWFSMGCFNWWTIEMDNFVGYFLFIIIYWYGWCTERDMSTCRPKHWFGQKSPHFSFVVSVDCCFLLTDLVLYQWDHSGLRLCRDRDPIHCPEHRRYYNSSCHCVGEHNLSDNLKNN